MDGALTPHVGKTVADYALDRGPPTNTIDMGANKRGFQSQLTGQTAGAVVPVSGMLVRQLDALIWPRLYSIMQRSLSARECQFVSSLNS
jgi:hypothetical protein